LRGNLSRLENQMMGNMIRPSGVIRASASDTAENRVSGTADRDVPMGVNDARLIESRPSIKLAGSFDSGGEQRGNFAMTRNRSKAGATSFKQS
jgi:hypothetical protein